MRYLSMLSVAALSAGLAAQSNTVAGLDGRLTVIDNMTYYGRRGPSYPNGEIGMAFLNTMCNPGSVNIPWYQAMQPNHPKFGFLVVRVANDRIEQINEWSFCKHAFLSINVNGQCGSCQNPGTGSLMGLNCSDTYGAGNNASRTWLGPPQEIDPWLGTWNPVGSYFDIGDPSQAGYPAPADGVRSLSQSIFDSVDNRVTIDEIDLTTPNAQYYYGLQLIHEGESVANRDDNLAHRGMTPTWSGSSWSFPNNGQGQQYGSVLDRWTGAEVNSGQNGNDDGRFFVASKVTSLGGGNYHYEYAIHNVDNSRGGGAFRVPIDAGATASNYSFGDIDTNGSNDWTVARIGNEIVFTATANNALEWNTIYNFGFDADFPAGATGCTIDEHRPGPGAAWVTVPTKAPSGATYANFTSVGSGCGGTQVICDEALYEYPNFDLQNSSFTLAYAAGQYTLVPGAGSWITPTGAQGFGDDTEQNFSIPFSLPHPGGTTSTLRVCSNGFVTTGSGVSGTNYSPSVAKFLPVEMWCALWRDLNPSSGGDVYVSSNSQRAVVSWVGVPNYSNSGSNTLQMQFWANGDVHVIYQNITVSGSYLVGYSVANAADPGGVDISASLGSGLTVCAGSAGTPDVALDASARPIIGTTIDMITTNIPLTSVGGLSILSLIPIPGGLDLTSLGMPGCYLYQDLTVIDLFPVAGGTGQRSFAIPSTPSLSGTVIRNQSAVMVLGINPFNIVTSNGLEMVVGLN